MLMVLHLGLYPDVKLLKWIEKIKTENFYKSDAMSITITWNLNQKELEMTRAAPPT